jgi:hypothetical protein
MDTPSVVVVLEYIADKACVCGLWVNRGRGAMPRRKSLRTVRTFLDEKRVADHLFYRANLQYLIRSIRRVLATS